MTNALGLHHLADFWGAARLDDRAYLGEALRDAATAAGATVLSYDSHGFGEGGGVTAVVMLAESHITIHTWPEHGFAAIDMFLCGAMDTDAALDLLKQRLTPDRVETSHHPRGQFT